MEGLGGCFFVSCGPRGRVALSCGGGGRVFNEILRLRARGSDAAREILSNLTNITEVMLGIAHKVRTL